MGGADAHGEASIVDESHFDSARAFLSALRLSHPRWLAEGATRSRWAFRGHRHADWPLVPSAWRFGPNDPLSVLKEACGPEDALLRCLSAGLTEDWERICQEGPLLLPGLQDAHALPVRLDRVIRQGLAEHRAVEHFLDLANEMGLAIPERPHPWDRLLDHRFDPPRPRPWMAGPAFGLAQHYGVPTRLLDWTRNPLVAAFFAADEAIEHGDAGTLAVWAYEAVPNGLRTPIVVEEYPHYGNPSLHAQHGLFTYVRDADREYLRCGRWLCIDMVPGVRLRKLMLPTREAEELLRLLHAERYSRAHLFPGYASVAQTARRWWRARKRPVP